MIKTYLGKTLLALVLTLLIGTSVSANTLSGTVTASTSSSLTAEDFGVIDSSGVEGYTAGFRLNNADFDDVERVVVRLYAGSKLLQTNVGTEEIEDLSGHQFSTPFDVFGDFDYEEDGYWRNRKQSEYGQNLIPTKVVARVELENGKILTATNTHLTGDPDTIFPDSDEDEDEEDKPVSRKNECKKGGWLNLFARFRNQGQCIKFFNHNW